MKKVLLIVLTFFSLEFASCGKSPYEPEKVISKYHCDGPYILGKSGDSRRMLVIDSIGQVIDSAIDLKNQPIQIRVYNSSHRQSFTFDYNERGFRTDSARITRSGKIYALSDPHGNFDYVVKNLKANGVIDDNYDWTYGCNQLVMIGDNFDRGNDVLPIYWLLYKLKWQANKEGGGVYCLLGDHEELILRDDNRYTKDKYMKNAEAFKMKYSDLFCPESVLGDWLDSQNTIQIIGDYLFVHAGISPTLVESGLTLEEINEMIRKGLRLEKSIRNKNDTLSMLFGRQGPLWYRGMVQDEEKYDFVDEEIVKSILDHYSVKKIIVGHTELDKTTYFHGEKIGRASCRERV